MVFAGDRIDVEAYNTRLRYNGSRLLPGKLIEAVSAETDDDDSPQSWRLGPINSSHTLAAVARTVPEQQLATARFNRIMKVRPDDDAVAILSLSDRTLPLLLEKRIGRGSVLMIATTADRQWSNFAVHPLYPMLLQQAVTHLTSRPGEKEFSVGEPGYVTVTGQKADARVTLRTPTPHSLQVKLSMLDTGEVICPIETDLPGIYDVVLPSTLHSPLSTHHSPPTSSMAVNVNPIEADVKVIDPTALAGKLGSVSAEVIADDANLAAIIKESREGMEISRTLLMLAMAVFLLQGYLAKRFTRRMGSTDTDVMQMVHGKTVVAARRTRS